MKAKLLKKLRKRAEFSIGMEYIYPYFYVVINIPDTEINGVISERFNDFGIAVDYVKELRRNYILSSTRQGRMVGRRIM